MTPKTFNVSRLTIAKYLSPLYLLGLVLVSLLLLGQAQALAQQPVTFQVGSGTISGIPGTLTVPVTMTVPAGVSIRGVTLDIHYDNSIVTASSGTASTQFVLSTCNVETPQPRNTVRSSHFVWFGSGQVVLCEVTFEAVSVGTGDLMISVKELIDNDLNALSYSTTSNSIAVEDATAITLVSFTAARTAGGVNIEWETATEIDNAGFNLYRATSDSGPYTKINPAPIPAKGEATGGAAYSYLDTAATNPDTAYYYKLEDVDLFEISTFHGPIPADPGADAAPEVGPTIYLPIILR